MLGINTFIVKMINNILKDFNTDKLIYFKKSTDVENEIPDKIICIDDINTYNKYLLENSEKVRFYAFDYIDLYYDGDEFDELLQLIYDYGEMNQIPIESYSEFNIEEVIEKKEQKKYMFFTM